MNAHTPLPFWDPLTLIPVLSPPVSLLFWCLCTWVAQWVSSELFTGTWTPYQWLCQWKSSFSPTPTPQTNHYLHVNPERGREPPEPFFIAWWGVGGPSFVHATTAARVMLRLEIGIPHPPPPSFRSYILSASFSGVFPEPSRGWYKRLA